MFFNGKHLCKSPHPFDATTFDLRHPSVRDIFKAVFEMTTLGEVVKEKSDVDTVTTYSDTLAVSDTYRDEISDGYLIQDTLYYGWHHILGWHTYQVTLTQKP